jgi:hypothetical protein
MAGKKKNNKEKTVKNNPPPKRDNTLKVPLTFEEAIAISIHTKMPKKKK